jgi:predicted nucleotide-binding protein
MPRADLLEKLRALYDCHDSLTTEEGGEWLARIAALIGQFDRESANEIKKRAQILSLPVSTGTIAAHWNLILQAVRNAIAYLEVANEQQLDESVLRPTERRVFIGHGRSGEWRKLKDFVVERLRLPYEEFNRESTAGFSTKERLQQMLASTQFALLVMTAEDQHSDGSHHARENVVHEIGLFQGRHGFERAIVLLEEGCVEFSNLTGLTQIRFPPGDILARSEEVRRVLEREGMLLHM